MIFMNCTDSNSRSLATFSNYTDIYNNMIWSCRRRLVFMLTSPEGARPLKTVEDLGKQVLACT